MIATQPQSTIGEADISQVPSSTGGGIARVWIDTHVHLHEQFNDERFFDATAANFAAVGSAGSGGAGVLCLTEMQDTDAFSRLSRVERIGRWSFVLVGEHAIEATRDDGVRLGLLAGRQVRCGDGLEVLALGKRVEVADGLAFEQVVDAVRNEAGDEALVVVPYGVGKWSGARGERVRELIEAGPDDVAYGDNSGRLGLGEQALLKLARQRGRTVLVGSDSLRIAAGEKRAGSWGVVLDVPGGERMDATWSGRIVAALRSAGPAPETFGSRVGTLAAVVQQIGVRLP